MRDNYGGFGAERQTDLYLAGLGGQPPSVPVSPEELEAEARAKLPPEAFDYVAGGAGGETTMRANRAAFDRWRLVPRMLTDVSARDTRMELFGRSLPVPVLLAPVGALEIVHPDGELAAARAAAGVGLPFVLSTAASHSIEEVAEAAGPAPRWFQLYWGRDREVNLSLARRARAAGYDAIVVTPDTKILGWRERDLRRGYLPFLRGVGVANFLTDPVFRSRLAAPPESAREIAVLRATESMVDPSFRWDDVALLARTTPLPVLVKGVLHPDDAERALGSGARGLIVSNHGGRQVDGSVAALDALPGVVSAVAGRAPVLFDGGIRRGADVLRALALGARAVLVGRPYVWGLAVGGEAAAREVLLNLLADFDLTLGLAGCATLAEVGRSLLVPEPGTGGPVSPPVTR